MIASIQIAGSVAPGFERVRDLFAAHFERGDAYREVGAALCAYEGDRKVVDLWGGCSDASSGAPWRPDTLVNVWSTTKGLAAACVAWCVDRGAFAYEDCVATVWPEFAEGGKADITIAQLMSHQAGLPGFVAPTTLEDLEDWALVAARLSAQAPAHRPGAANSYHAVTYGILAGELVRRATGKTLGQIAADEICGPLGADFFIGLADKHEHRVAPLLAPRTPAQPPPADLSDVAKMALTNPAMDPARANLRSWRAAEMPALNGHASARGVARLYAALANGGEIDRVRIISQNALDQMTTVQTIREDLMLGFRPHWGMGIIHNEVGVYGPNPKAFGHSGWGGSFGCADRDAQIAIGYVMNQMGPDLVGDPRGAGLAATIFDCAGR